MTTKTERPHNVPKVSSTDPGTFAFNGAQPPPAEAGTSGPTATPLTPLVSGVHLLDRISKPLRTLKESEWRCLHERGGLIELKFNRRGKLLHVRIQNGVSLAAINAALRVGMRDRLPMPPPTVIQIRHVGIRYEHNARVCRTYGPPCPDCGGYHDGACES